jgi:uncharacterized RDD family membrane protein YckC
VNRILGTLLNPVVDAVDVDSVLERVDLDEALARVDIDALLARVDINGVLDRVDVAVLLDRVDVDGLLDRIDVDRLLARIDIAKLVNRAEIGNVVTDSASSAAFSVLDFARAQLAGFDAVATTVAGRLLRRRRLGTGTHERAIVGAPAGPFTRLAAYAIDTSLITAFFGLGVFLLTYLGNLFFEHNFDPTAGHGGPWWALAAAAFAALYWWIGLAVAGRTVGKALVGLRVVRRDGSALGARVALIRVVAFPFSFIFFGLGFVGILFGRNRRALHDVVARTKEVYDWGDRIATLPRAFVRWV